MKEYTFEQTYFLNDTLRDINTWQNIADNHFDRWLITKDENELREYHWAIDAKHKIEEIRNFKIEEWSR